MAKDKEKYDKEMEKDEVKRTIPEEFIDPIMQTLMNDPVLLPTSNVILDRVTINKHLMIY